MIEEDEQTTDDEDGFDDVGGDAPPTGEYRLSTRGPVVGGSE